MINKYGCLGVMYRDMMMLISMMISIFVIQLLAFQFYLANLLSTLLYLLLQHFYLFVFLLASVKYSLLQLLIHLVLMLQLLVLHTYLLA